MTAYCTYFDSGYLSRGLALIGSLREHGDDSPIWVLALDDEVPRRIAEMHLDDVQVIRVHEMEAAFPRLAGVRAERTRMEYYFTMTPLLIAYVMDHSPAGTAVAYLDADMWFFSEPAAVWEVLGAGSVGIIEHRYPPRLARRLAQYGTYNVGWVGFRNDEPGRACLAWWGEQTIEWCRDTPADGKYADQGYLDEFPRRFEGVVVLQHLGADAAPWNSSRWSWTTNEQGVRVDGDPLLFFHFHGLRRVSGWWVSSQLGYAAPMGRVLRDHVYTPYVRALERWDALLPPAPKVARRGVGLRGRLFALQRATLTALSVLTRNAVRATASRQG